MYITPRRSRIRNVSLSMVNSTITLIILLIAPLGLATVIVNTLLVAIATYTTGSLIDRITLYLNQENPSTLPFKPTQATQIRRH
ncbi:MAG: CRISPR-associated protein Csx18 [Synechococcales bacterium]|nr:CRISPR-associated protein Csx18 [Synechococcales bacterium]